MKTKKQLEGWIQKLNDDADMREYALEQEKIAQEEKLAARIKQQQEEELQRQNEED